VHKLDLILTLTGGLASALAMTESRLRQMGASPEQLDRERERIHTELFSDH